MTMKKNTDSKPYFSLRSPQIICWAFFLFNTINLTSKFYSQLDSVRFHFNSQPTIGLKMETKNFVIKTINNKYSRFFKFIFFLRYLFAIFFISIALFLTIPGFFNYEKR